ARPAGPHPQTVTWPATPHQPDPPPPGRSQPPGRPPPAGAPPPTAPATSSVSASVRGGLLCDPDRVERSGGGGAGLAVLVVSDEGPDQRPQDVGDEVPRLVGLRIGAFLEQTELGSAPDVTGGLGVVMDGVHGRGGHG